MASNTAKEIVDRALIITKDGFNQTRITFDPYRSLDALDDKLSDKAIKIITGFESEETKEKYIKDLRDGLEEMVETSLHVGWLRGQDSIRLKYGL